MPIFFSVADTAYAKNKDDGRWYHFDDSSVTPIGEGTVVVMQSAYSKEEERDMSFTNADFTLFCRPKQPTCSSIRGEKTHAVGPRHLQRWELHPPLMEQYV